MIDPWSHLHGDPRPEPLPGDMAMAAIIILMSAGAVLFAVWECWPWSGWAVLAVAVLVPAWAAVTR